MILRGGLNLALKVSCQDKSGSYLDQISCTPEIWSEASLINSIYKAKHLVVRETPKAISTKVRSEKTNWPRNKNLGMVIMKLMKDIIYLEMGNPHGYDLTSIWLEYGQPPETERMLACDEGLTILNALKIQSILLGKLKSSECLQQLIKLCKLCKLKNIKNLFITY